MSYYKDFYVFAVKCYLRKFWNKRKFRIESYDPSSTVDLDIWSRRQSDRAKMIILQVMPPIRIYSIKNLARARARTKSSTGLPGSVTLMLIVMMLWMIAIKNDVIDVDHDKNGHICCPLGRGTL